ncbi:hypothetical protein GT350_12515, partial [Streptomyces sp. SID1034]|nr:hypothetical protein [Streptomyces sp. SID1034]
MGRHTKDSVEAGRAERIAGASERLAAASATAPTASGAHRSPDAYTSTSTTPPPGAAYAGDGVPPPQAPHTGARHEHRWLVLGVIALAQLMVVLDATIVNIALPSA